jgi:hypothetical protein
VAHTHANPTTDLDADAQVANGHAHAETTDSHAHATTADGNTVTHAHGSDAYRNADTYARASHRYPNSSASYSDLFTDTRSRLRTGHDGLL